MVLSSSAENDAEFGEGGMRRLFNNPRDEKLANGDRQLRDQLLVVDLAVHLADEAVAGAAPDAHFRQPRNLKS